jgi:hypothetical protein
MIFLKNRFAALFLLKKCKYMNKKEFIEEFKGKGLEFGATAPFLRLFSSTTAIYPSLKRPIIDAQTPSGFPG